MQDGIKQLAAKGSGDRMRKREAKNHVGCSASQIAVDCEEKKNRSAESLSTFPIRQYAAGDPRGSRLPEGFPSNLSAMPRIQFIAVRNKR